MPDPSEEHSTQDLPGTPQHLQTKHTGPRTPFGKKRSSRNAAKHWLTTKGILPQEGNEAAVLREKFEEDLAPTSFIEIELIDDLVFCRLVKRRIDNAFTREFRKAAVAKRDRPA